MFPKHVHRTLQRLECSDLYLQRPEKFNIVSYMFTLRFLLEIQLQCFLRQSSAQEIWHLQVALPSHRKFFRFCFRKRTLYVLSIRHYGVSHHIAVISQWKMFSQETLFQFYIDLLLQNSQDRN